MKYIIAPSYREGDIIHAASGTQRANHKYIDRVMGKNGKWQYIYKTSNKNRITGLGLKERKNLNKQTIESGLRTANIRDSSKYSDAQKKQLEYQERKKLADARSAYDNTLLGRIGKKLSSGMNWLEKKGIITSATSSKSASELSKERRKIKNSQLISRKKRTGVYFK